MHGAPVIPNSDRTLCPFPSNLKVVVQNDVVKEVSEHVVGFIHAQLHDPLRKAKTDKSALGAFRTGSER